MILADRGRGPPAVESDNDGPVTARWVAEFVSGPDDGRFYTFHTARLGNVGAGVAFVSIRSPDRRYDVSTQVTLITVGASSSSEVAEGMVDLVLAQTGCWSVVRDTVQISWKDLPDNPHDIAMLNQAIGMVRGVGAAAANWGP